MSSHTPSRRDFLGGAAAGAAALLGARPARAADAPKARPLVRRDIYSLDPDGPEIAALRKGVAVMKARPSDDPTGWVYQANLHGTYDQPLKPGWATCQHGNYWFPPWHRMEVYFFERILRAASGDPTLTLPYWNYSSPAARALPLALRRPADPAKNPLYEPLRNRDWGGVNDGAEVPASAAAVFPPFAFINYTAPDGTGDGFGGQGIKKPDHYDDPHGAFEAWHDIIHIIVGGEGGLMSDPNTAPRDFVYWLHHCNVDRLWKRWLDQGGGRENPVGDRTWMAQKFLFFDEAGKPVEMACADCLSTESQLGYRYDDDPPPVPRRISAAVPAARPRPAKPKVLAATTEPGVIRLGPEPAAATIKLTPEVSAAMLKAAAPGSGSALQLTIDDISHEKATAVYFEVYLNLPDDVKEPDYQSVHFVGTFAFFGLKPVDRPKHLKAGTEEEPDEGDRTYFITDVVNALVAGKLWNEHELTVTSVMRGLTPPAGHKGKVTRPPVKARYKQAFVTLL
jgi:tyrosinase